MLTKQNKSNLLLDNLDKLIESNLLEGKKIVLFGLNISSYATKDYLEKKGYKIHAYIDNNEQKLLDLQELFHTILPKHIPVNHSKFIQDSIVKAYKPEDGLVPFRDDYLILISSKYYPTMLLQLNKLGYQENIHVMKTVDFQGIDEIIAEETDIQGLREMDTKAIRKKQLELVAYVVDTCKKHNLNIFMGGGTLLGAVRHQGYIPWDDDIDLLLPMPDYKKLIDIITEEDRYDAYSIYQNEYCNNFYLRVIDRNTIVKRWTYPFLTTAGVDIDVFPLMGLPARADETKAFFNRLRHIYGMYNDSFLTLFEDENTDHSFRDKLKSKIIEMTERYDFYESQQAGYILSKYWERDIMPRSIYDKTIYLKFEDMELPAPSGYDAYLQYLFGDYMKLPSEKDRYAPHNYRAYYKE